MGEWASIPLGEVAENFDSIRVPVKASDRKPGPYPYYGAQGIVDYVSDFIFEGEYILVAEDGENLRSRNEDIAFIVRGKFWVNNHAHIIRGNGKADTRFLYYAINASDVSGYITGSTIPKLSQRNLNALQIPIPPLPEQRAIAAVLSALDDKIALNRRMNETLEGLARALFKDWFVHFGPTRAKASGAKPTLAPEIWSLFPDRLDENGVPEGWEMGTLADIAQSPRRGVKPADVAEDTPYIGLEHMPRRSIALSDWDGAGKVSSNKSRFREGEFLFGKLRPYFHKVGVAAVDGICSTDIVVVTPKAEEWAALTLACISSDDFVEYTNAGSTGTKMPRTSWKIMGAYEMCIPPRELAQAYQTLVGPMIEKIIENIHQSRTLAQTRDLLLPKLMSGALRVGAAEEIVEGAF